MARCPRGSHREGPRSRHGLPHAPRPRHLAIPALLALAILAGCASTTVVGRGSSPTSVTSTATATAAPTDPACAAALPSGRTIAPGIPAIAPLAFPPGTIGTTATPTVEGTDLFSVYGFDACSPRTTAGAVAAYFAAQLPALPHGWSPSPLFPYDGGLMQRCAGGDCWSATGGVPYVYADFEALKDAGQGAVTYLVRYAVSPDPGGCAQVPGSGAYDFFLPDFGPGPQVPLPPMSRAGANDAPHLHAWMVCSPGTTASITAFLNKELPATGWKTIAASNAACAFASCWANAGQVISWSVGDPTQWSIGYR